MRPARLAQRGAHVFVRPGPDVVGERGLRGRYVGEGEGVRGLGYVVRLRGRRGYEKAKDVLWMGAWEGMVGEGGRREGERRLESLGWG